MPLLSGRRTLMIVKFEVTFQADVWAALSVEGRQQWLDDVEDAINSEAYVSGVEVVRR
jgi:hypothetical protein